MGSRSHARGSSTSGGGAGSSSSSSSSGGGGGVGGGGGDSATATTTTTMRLGANSFFIAVNGTAGLARCVPTAVLPPLPDVPLPAGTILRDVFPSRGREAGSGDGGGVGGGRGGSRGSNR